MKQKINFKPRKSGKTGNILTAGLLLFFGLLMAWVMLLAEPMTVGQPYNQTALVNTTVNITNSAPLIYAITLDTPINLIAYDNKTVYCNVTVFDYDNQTLELNATLYINGVSTPTSADDGNNHYTNASCSRITSQDRLMNYTCSFDLRYYADNTTNWICNATVKDSEGVSASNVSNYATVTPLVAIKIPDLLDYGNLAVNQISNDTAANVTNAGNRNANISVEGYGQTPLDGYAFICDFGTIALSYERYNVTVNSTFSDMSQLTGATTMIPSFYVPQRTSESADSINQTYWKVQIPIGAGGVCNGKILFTATDKGN